MTDYAETVLAGMLLQADYSTTKNKFSFGMSYMYNWCLSLTSSEILLFASLTVFNVILLPIIFITTKKSPNHCLVMREYYYLSFFSWENEISWKAANIWDQVFEPDRCGFAGSWLQVVLVLVWLGCGLGSLSLSLSLYLSLSHPVREQVCFRYLGPSQQWDISLANIGNLSHP